MFDAARLRALQAGGSASRELRARRERERADARAVAAARREQREDRKLLLSEMRGEADVARQTARSAYEALRQHPLYGMWRTWAPRMDRGTLYDAKQWRERGRLVPVTERTKYTQGGRREVIDWTDALDREAQQAGVHTLDLPREFERLSRQEHAARLAAREADARAAEWREMRDIWKGQG